MLCLFVLQSLVPHSHPYKDSPLSFPHYNKDMSLSDKQTKILRSKDWRGFGRCRCSPCSSFSQGFMWAIIGFSEELPPTPRHEHLCLWNSDILAKATADVSLSLITITCTVCGALLPVNTILFGQMWEICPRPSPQLPEDEMLSDISSQMCKWGSADNAYLRSLEEKTHSFFLLCAPHRGCSVGFSDKRKIHHLRVHSSA